LTRPRGERRSDDLPPTEDFAQFFLVSLAGQFVIDIEERLGDIDYETWIRTLNVITLGPVRVVETLRGNLVKGRDKKVIAITSAMGSNTRHDGAALIYRSSKAALNNAMRGLSIALKADGIIVVPMHPGWVQTDMGGATAPLTPKQSITQIRRVISELSPTDSGRYLNYDGTEIPW
jgi:NAD(P)-dependent dehydrogenase (short-subunit alcohol dehydrogenase family)